MAVKVLRFRGSRLLTLAFVLTLGAGVGITAALFNAIDALLFRPPAHVAAPDRIVRVRAAANYVQYRRLSAEVRSLELAAYTRPALTVGLNQDTVTVPGECVTPNYFDVIGATAAVGRFWSPAANPDHVTGAVISDGLWTRMFGRQGDLSRLRLTLSGRSYPVVAVARAGFTGVDSEPVDVWLSLASAPDLCSFSGSSLLASDGGAWLRTIGRLRESVTVDQAEAELAAIGATRAAGASSDRSQPEVRPLVASRRDHLSLEARTGLWSAGGALVVLLIACANVVVFIALRAMDRRLEVAIRLQLGATPARVFLLFLLENLTLTALCLASALAVAVWMEAALRSFFPPRTPGLSLTVVAIIAGFTLFMGLASSVIPAVEVARSHSASLLRTGARAAHRGSRRRSVLLAAQLALAYLLLVAGASFLQSVDKLTNDAGYSLDDAVVVATLEFERKGYTNVEAWDRVQQVMNNIRTAPGVASVSVSSGTLLGSGGATVGVGISPVPVTPGELPSLDATSTVMINGVSAGYFESLGTRIVHGRGFSSNDDTSARQVGIVDEQLARAFWGAEDPVGKCVFVGWSQSCVEVVGVSEPRRSGHLTLVQDEFFIPSTQAAFYRSLHQTPRTLFVRSEAPRHEVIPLIASSVQRVAPDTLVGSVRPLIDLANAQTRSWRLGANTFYLYGVLAALMAATGLYGAIALAVRQRSTELAIRVALGATPLDVANIVLRNVIVILVAGWLAGTALTLAYGGMMDRLLFEVTPADPGVVIRATMLMCGVALAGCVVPVARVVRHSPASALRQA